MEALYTLNSPPVVSFKMQDDLPKVPKKIMLVKTPKPIPKLQKPFWVLQSSSNLKVYPFIPLAFWAIRFRVWGRESFLISSSPQ